MMIQSRFGVFAITNINRGYVIGEVNVMLFSVSLYKISQNIFEHDFSKISSRLRCRKWAARS